MIARAGLATLSVTQQRGAVVGNQPKNRSTLVTDIGKRDYCKRDAVDDEVDGGDGGSLEESYLIDPSVQLFKSVDFGRRKTGNARVDPEVRAAKTSPVNVTTASQPHLKSSYSGSPIHSQDTLDPFLDSEPTLLEGACAGNCVGSGGRGGSRLASGLSRVSGRTARNDRDDLIDELERMRAQNDALLSQMERTQVEAQRVLQSERADRQNAEFKLRKQNTALTEKLLQAQRQSENDLNLEREKLRRAMRSMEQEKEELARRVQEIEERSESEKFQQEYLRAEFKLKLERIEAEKVHLSQSLAKHEASMAAAAAVAKTEAAALAAPATAAVDPAESTGKREWEQQRLDLIAKITAMEEEKEKMAKDLKLSEAMSEQNAQVLAQQLAQERTELQEAVKQMEGEKQQLTASVMAKEKEVKGKAHEAKQQLEKDREQLAELMEALERERKTLQDRLLIFSGNEVELQMLRAQVAELDTEKLALADKLAAADASIKDRDVKQSRKKRESLKDSMRKLQEAKKVKSPAKSDIVGSSPVSLSPVHSLFGSMEQYGSSQALNQGSASVSFGRFSAKGRVRSKSSVKSSPMSRDIQVIPENEETSHPADTFLSWDDDEATRVQGGSGAPLSQDDDEDSSGFNDLPAPHAAAARGELPRLRALKDLEAGLISCLDKSGRTPLFYAVAYGHLATARFLAESCPQQLYAADTHGDTPLHVASSAGHYTCLEFLLQALSQGDFTPEAVKEHIDPRNGLGMSPIHMASTAECMELLYSFGADIAATDAQGRSPLFVACAMNRLECAEFLVTSLDHIESSLLQRDNRGDTPLHAAACNGSVDCLLLLLQFGIDPKVLNEKGLRAIELAARNKQTRCKELLTEYQIHYGTNSDFDSVLFLATLEGQRMLKDLNVVTDADGAKSYQIIKKYSTEAQASRPLAATAAQNLQAQPSFFSMNNGKSLRLQKWGLWIAYEDQVNKTVYWYNSLTKSGQWNKPEEVVDLQLCSSESFITPTKTLKVKMSMRLKKVGDWIMYRADRGPAFYYNEKNGEFQWETPTTAHSNSKMTMSSGGAGGGEDVDSSDGKTSATQPVSGSQTESSSAVWRPYVDPATGHIFWYNQVTNVSQWECPDELIPPEITANKQLFTPSANDSDVVTVVHEDDLGL